MMSRFIKNNFKIIIVAVVTAVICISGTVFATSYFAKDISYTTSKNESIKSVEDALNDLYTNVKPFSITSSVINNIKTVNINNLQINSRYKILISGNNSSGSGAYGQFVNGISGIKDLSEDYFIQRYANGKTVVSWIYSFTTTNCDISLECTLGQYFDMNNIYVGILQ